MNRTRTHAQRMLLLTLPMLALLGLARPAAAADSFSPNPVNLTLAAGQSASVAKTLHLDALPGKADIIIAIDTTGSMGPAIAQAKAEATQLVNDIQAQIPGARFAVVDFKDYSDGAAVYVLKTPGFTPSAAAVQAAINTMAPGGGGDFAEAYNRVFYEAYSDPALTSTRDPDAVQFLVVLGDAPPHDANQTVAPACGDRPPTDPAGSTASVIAGLNANDITLLMIRYQNFIPLACYQQLAGATGGTAVNGGGGASLSSQIIAGIEAAAASIDEVRLVLSAGCPLGVTFSPPNPPPYGPYTAPVDINFTETVTAPTTAGNHSCTVTAIVDGTPRAEQVINVTVTAGPPDKLTLTPPSATNTAGEQHCVTATVTDAFGNPVPAEPVNFAVSGANSAAGTVSTDANGQATFCYTGTVAGDDTITATAQGGNKPTAAAAKTYRAGPPATLTLTPPTATNVVDTQHCVTATVRDQFGNPVPGATVNFGVSGSTSASGSGTTDANGQAQFCYTGPPLPGADVITATAVGGSNPTATAAKRWAIPPSTPGCKVTNGGRITAANGDKATFGGTAQADGLRGNEEYQDHGPAVNINVHSIDVQSVVCSADGKQASIFGTATVNGSGVFNFRIDVKDLGEPGRADTYRIRLSNGYDSGERVLDQGNIQIHK